MNAPAPSDKPLTQLSHEYGPTPLVATLMSWLAIAWFATIAYTPPEANTGAVDNNTFSATNAAEYHKQLFSDGVSHPSGSPQNKIVREKIVRQLETFGYTVETQSSKQKIRYSREENEPDELTIHNLIAIKLGDPSLGKVMLVAHYDSVPYGPGASDDGVAVAVNLEIAKMASTQLVGARNIIFLFTDGEEYGLLGARAFVDENQLAKEVEFVVNLEARGTTGPSLMFQTSTDSLQMLQTFSKSVQRPVTSSIFEEVYKRLPRDTDFTIFRDKGKMRGFNFAFIGDARKYHTAEDTVANADIRSMQHHGDNAWALVKQLAHSPAMEIRAEQAVYFDVFGRWLVFWNSPYSLIFSIGFSATVLLSGAWLLNRGRAKTMRIAKLALVVFIATIGVSICFAGLDFSFHLENRFQPPWVDSPAPIALAFWTAGLTAFLFVSQLFKCWLFELEAWLVVWTNWAVAAILCSSTIVGASYLFVVPTGVAILSRTMCWCFQLPNSASNILTSIATAILFIPIGVLFYDALGYSANSVVCLRCCLMCTTLIPTIAATRKNILSIASWTMLGLCLTSTTIAIISNPAN